ncbi:hypothetical protein AB0E96_12690 [Kitasatospora sp. NPDC036755]|uniref:hypothetical protein n=1 Tax=Kitasatospora sp. NPDC036755 TaxID=3154600 RepID=UPI0033D4D548
MPVPVLADPDTPAALPALLPAGRFDLTAQRRERAPAPTREPGRPGLPSTSGPAS